MLLIYCDNMIFVLIKHFAKMVFIKSVSRKIRSSACRQTIFSKFSYIVSSLEHLVLKACEHDHERPQSQTNTWHREEETQNTNSHTTANTQLK